MTRKLINPPLDALERTNVQQLGFGFGANDQTSPIVHGESLDGEPKFKSRVRERHRILPSI